MKNGLVHEFRGETVQAVLTGGAGFPTVASQAHGRYVSPLLFVAKRLSVGSRIKFPHGKGMPGFSI
jgi:hypothetical protein